MLNPLDVVQAQYSTDDIPKAVNNVNLTGIAITGGTVVVLCVTVFIKSQPLLTRCVYENESNLQQPTSLLILQMVWLILKTV